MGKQFDRVYRLLVGVDGSDGIVIEGKPKENALNITFDIDKDLTKQTNKSVSYTHLRAHETRHDLVCRLLLEKKKNRM